MADDLVNLISWSIFVSIQNLNHIISHTLSITWHFRSKFLHIRSYILSVSIISFFNYLSKKTFKKSEKLDPTLFQNFYSQEFTESLYCSATRSFIQNSKFVHRKAKLKKIPPSNSFFRIIFQFLERISFDIMIRIWTYPACQRRGSI